MWIELTARHPYELVVLNGLINALPIYLGFTIAARLHAARTGERAGGGRAAIAVGVLAASVLWGGTTVIDRHFSIAMLHLDVSVVDLLRAEPTMVLMPIVGSVVVVAIAHARTRALVTLGAIAFYVAFLENPHGTAAFGELAASERWMHWGIVVLGAAMAAAGAAVMTTRSHSSRLSAVLAACWGNKIIGTALLSAQYPGFDLLAPMGGTLTPALLGILSLTVAGAAAVAMAEARRLQGADFRHELVRESERRMRRLADASQEGLVIHEGGVVRDANDRLRALVGVPDPVGMRLTELIPAAGAWKATERFAAGPTRTALRGAHGTEIAVEAVCRPIDGGRDGEAGRDGGRIVTALRDVSERDRAVAEAARERKRLRLALDAADEGFVIFDRDERMVLANQAYLSLAPGIGEVVRPGMRHEEIARAFADAGLWPDDIDREALLAERMAMFRAGTQDHVARLADGRWLLARDRKLPTGETVSMRIDVTRVKERERELEASEARVRFLARNDALTGIPNRRTFDADLAARIGRTVTGGAHRLALLMIDLDRFKPVNDQYGHAAGDELLRVLAARLGGEMRSRPRLAAGEGAEPDMVARIGGDEFAALARVADRADAMALAERLRGVAERPVALDVAGGSVRVSVGACVGVAIGPDDAAHGEGLLHAADLALYAAKDAGRGRAVAFEPAMAEAAENRRRMEEDLSRALERGEIELHYQVQHCMRSNRPVGFEALMRWRHPERGLVSPAEFIPLAEETGLIVPLGRWALERATRDFAAMPGGMRVAVNVSPVQFGSGDLAADVARALAVSSLDPARLEVEITEQVLIDDAEATLRTLDAIRALGVGLSLDDFGSGYSSLGYLTRYPFTKIKIDRMFIAAMGSDERARALVRSILALAASLGLRVTAEGVETQGQLLSLAADGCNEAQGYLLGRPVPLDELDRAALAA